MPRVKSNVVRLKRKKQILQHAKGAFGGRSKLRDFRRLWIIRINAAARQHDMSYSVFINGLAAAGIEIDRKVLSDLAIREPEAFAAIADKVRQALDAAKSAA